MDCSLWQGDCLKEMYKIPDKSVDMILCDLPYGVTQNKADIVIPFDDYIEFEGKKYTFIELKKYIEKTDKPNSELQYKYFNFIQFAKQGLWSHYKRIIKDNGCIVLFAQGKFYVDLVNSNPDWFRYDLVWDKVLTTGFLNAKVMPLRQHEQIAVFYKKLPTYNPQFTVGEALHGKGTAYSNNTITNNNYGDFKPNKDSRAGTSEKYPTSLFPTVLEFKKSHPSVAEHRTEKPVQLLSYLILTYTNEGDTVLDNCMGSGSTGLACIETNRNFIGIELNEEIFNKAVERIDYHNDQLKLF